MINVIGVVCGRTLIWFLEHCREEPLHDSSGDLGFLARIQTTFQHQHIWDGYEDLCITAIDLFLEKWVLLTSAMDHLAKADELLSLIPWHQVSPAQAPGFLKSGH